MYISFGALSPSIKEQLEEYPVNYDEKQIETVQKLVEATNLLRIQGVLTSAQSDSCYKKILKRIQKAVKV